MGLWALGAVCCVVGFLASITAFENGSASLGASGIACSLVGVALEAIAMWRAR